MVKKPSSEELSSLEKLRRFWMSCTSTNADDLVRPLLGFIKYFILNPDLNDYRKG